VDFQCSAVCVADFPCLPRFVCQLSSPLSFGTRSKPIDWYTTFFKFFRQKPRLILTPSCTLSQYRTTLHHFYFSMAAAREQNIPEDPNAAPVVNNRVCAHANNCCTTVPVLINSPYLCDDELRRIGCCGKFPCDITSPLLLACLQYIPNTQIPPYAPPNQFRFAAYRHLVCVDAFGEVNPADPQRRILNCCILHRVRCTWPSPTAQYTGHVTIAGYLPITPV
jgi:hypothetical protein